ncbi:MAG TPA: sulfatase-like hydrolase/transferase [Sphaerochaeta sp.]|nr:sulfatase-like hydrolase/transferase [Sphaerochaeta sp.]HQB04597.1 sulfatase-like hydrolase/transferase [Sphaerochaeta sp.]
MKKPNIVFYFSDQQRFDTLGCYGQKLPLSPRIDELAKNGVRFDLAFSPQPVCGPCRAIFQTGLYATQLGCFRNNIALPPDVKTTASYFEDNGYETAYIGKWHLASTGGIPNEPTQDYKTTAIPPYLRGGYTGFWRVSDVLEFTSDGYGGFVFDENMKKHEFSGYRADCIADYAVEFLNEYDGKKPFFMTVSQIEPHHQNNANHHQGPKGSKEKYKSFELPEDLRQLGGGDAEEEYPDYLGACERIDANLGKIVDTLKERGLWENTILFFTSDHGSHFRTRNKDGNLNGYDDYKRTAHDSALRVPLVVHGGPFVGGKTVSKLVSTASLPKTFLALAGIEEIEPMIGEDLSALINGSLANRANEIFAQISESRVGRAMRTEEHKYAVYAPHLDGRVYPSSSYYVDDYLYDLKNDPYELNNLVKDPIYTQVKDDLRKRLTAWIFESEHMEVTITDA